MKVGAYFHEKNITLKALIPGENKERNFLYENNLPKDLKKKISCKLRSQAIIHHLAIFGSCGVLNQAYITQQTESLEKTENCR